MKIESLGTYTPPHFLSMDDRDQIAQYFVHGTEKEKWFLPYIFEKSQVQRRHSALLNASEGDLLERQDLFRPADGYPDGMGPSTAERMLRYEQIAIGMAEQACRDAFRTSHAQPADITHLVTASCTGFSAPGFDLQLIDTLKLKPTVARTHLGFMGCHAGLNCLRTARAYAASDPSAKVLVCTTELCGLHYQYAGSNDQKIANAIFADGAGAAIVSHLEATGEHADAYEIAANGSYVLPGTSDLMTWKIGDHGFTMGLSEKIPATIETYLSSWLTGWLDSHGLTPEMIAGWAVHPGGPQILNAFQAAMKLPASELQHSWDVLRENGNMSSSTIFFVLQRFQQAGAGSPLVAIGFGPGLTIEACLIR